MPMDTSFGKLDTSERIELTELEKQIARLERQLRSWRRVVTLIGASTLTMICVGWRSPDQVADMIVVKRGLSIMGQDGKPRVHTGISTDKSSRFSVADAQGRSRLEVRVGAKSDGWNGFAVLDEAGVRRVFLGDEGGNQVIETYQSDGKLITSMGRRMKQGRSNWGFIAMDPQDRDPLCRLDLLWATATDGGYPAAGITPSPDRGAMDCINNIKRQSFIKFWGTPEGSQTTAGATEDGWASFSMTGDDGVERVGLYVSPINRVTVHAVSDGPDRPGFR